jgi:hypothetical protein
MGRKPGVKIGGRGCPTCGSHDTISVGRSGLQMCITCDYRWFPCSPGCRGYDLDVGTAPRILGCTRCGVSDAIAVRWPEAWRAMAYRLDGKKLEPLE